MSRFEDRACAWCQQTFTPTNERGRPPSYCRQACRQRAYEARRIDELAAENELLRSILRRFKAADVMYRATAGTEPRLVVHVHDTPRGWSTPVPEAEAALFDAITTEERT